MRPNFFGGFYFSPLSQSPTSTKEAQAGRPRPRIEGLSDLIFGLALSIGAISLVGNISSIISDGILAEVIVIYAFSFLILISVWLRYTRIMSVLPLENYRTAVLNVALLFTVSIEPFLFNLLQLGANQIKDFASQVYAGDLGIMMAILGGFSFVLTSEEKHLIPKDLIREFKMQSAIMFMAAAFFLISIPIPFSYMATPNLPLRDALWIVPFILSGVVRRTSRIIGAVKKHS